MTVFLNMYLMYNMYKIKLHRTSKCLWPIYIDIFVVILFFFFVDIFVNNFLKAHRSVLHKITKNLLYFWDIYNVSVWENFAL